ncbi:MAG TPA: GNAT family N-acetyltransferase [Thermomicrobiales bacterium]|nr:GNAT family N-acetyltransferase [Thermomicrobiales bacterium]
MFRHLDLHISLLTHADVDACFAIGTSLPSWFGDEVGLAEMRRSLAMDEGYVARIHDRVVGFVTCARPFVETWEIAWLAVVEDLHRRGVGRKLVDAVIAKAHSECVSMLTVKTLADTHPSPEYAETRAFYAGIGFVRIVALPEYWSRDNPCLILARSLD